jgi:hypothetical protein
MDDDVETDDDQLDAANSHVQRELGEGIRSFKRNKRSLRNIHLLNVSKIN